MTDLRISPAGGNMGGNATHLEHGHDEAGEPHSDGGAPTLSAAQAQSLRARQPTLRPTQVVGWQWVAGGVAAVVAVLLRDVPAAISVLYGTAAVALPSWGQARWASRPGATPLRSLMRLAVAQGVKLLLVCALLALAPKLLSVGLRWPWLMVGLVVSLKASWWAALKMSVRTSGQSKNG